MKNLCNIPKYIAIRLRGICDDDVMLVFDKISLILKLNVITREHMSSTFTQKFSVIRNKE